ncbi:helix-turn-helix domain-containing protein [Arthrobacter sp.]|uniref:winged helix-turn-helix transcriptional regulator n=1 Tax=Arthrobacter sp. TaxID=1667 RepID=UPI002897A8AD|nr:helix-turn-helix domain-containing protein [Arthrobacter sp.]
MITSPRSGCPVNRALEMIGDQWSLVILRDIAAYDRRSFRELCTANEEGISAPVLSRRLADLTTAGFLTKADTAPGKQGQYSLTELGLQTIPLMVELARLGVLLDPETARNAPEFVHPSSSGGLEAEIGELRRRHLGG